MRIRGKLPCLGLYDYLSGCDCDPDDNVYVRFQQGPKLGKFVLSSAGSRWTCSFPLSQEHDITYLFPCASAVRDATRLVDLSFNYARSRVAFFGHDPIWMFPLSTTISPSYRPPLAGSPAHSHMVRL